jgi:hypothetical protein
VVPAKGLTRPFGAASSDLVCFLVFALPPGLRRYSLSRYGRLDEVRLYQRANQMSPILVAAICRDFSVLFTLFSRFGPRTSSSRFSFFPFPFTIPISTAIQCSMIAQTTGRRCNRTATGRLPGADLEPCCTGRTPDGVALVLSLTTALSSPPPPPPTF